MLQLVANQDASLFLGEDLITYLVLAFGGALFVGNVAAIVRPPSKPGDQRRPGRTNAERSTPDDELRKAPLGRSLVMAGIGLVAAIWALASLLSG